MKTTIASIAAAVALTVSASAFATDNVGSGKVTFNGTVSGVSCTISVNGAGNDAVVNLPVVNVDELKAGEIAKRTSFDIALTGCNNAKDKALSVTWTEASFANQTNGWLANTADEAASDVYISLFNKGSKDAIIPGASAVSSVATVAGNSATFTYDAGYVTSGAPTAGKVKSEAVYTVSYE